MKAPSPAFSFYPKDILSDELAVSMTDEELGVYVRLLCHAWLEGSIPADPSRLARLARRNRRSFLRVWPAIRPCWTEAPGDPDRLVQGRLELERTKQRQYSAKQADRARGHKARVSLEESTKGSSRGSAAVKPETSRKVAGSSLPSPSPSPSPSPRSTDNGNGIVGQKPDDASEFREAARELFQYWRLAVGQKRAQWSEDRGRLLVGRLREEPGTVAEKLAGLKLAVDGAVRDPWFNGTETGRSYLDFDNVFKNKGRGRIEKLQRLAESPETTRGGSRADRIDAKVTAARRRAQAADLVRSGLARVGPGGGDD